MYTLRYIPRAPHLRACIPKDMSRREPVRQLRTRLKTAHREYWCTVTASSVAAERAMRISGMVCVIVKRLIRMGSRLEDGKPVGCQIPYSKGTKLPISGAIFDGTKEVCEASGGALNNETGNCVISYANGAPLPDGDYVYVLWAEVPYTDVYYNGAACITDQNAAGNCNLSQSDWNCTGTNGKYECTVNEQPCSPEGSAPVPVVCSGAYTGVKTQRRCLWSVGWWTSRYSRSVILP